MDAVGWRTFLRRLPERIWFRLALVTALALLLVAVAWGFADLLPDAFAIDFGQGAVSGILQILATSMLAVTTFSLTAMISAYAAAARGTTPRATQLLISDPTSQNALSTFLGTFVFAIVGLVALSANGFGEKGRTVLFLGTLIVIAVVVGTLLRWIHHLTRFGRVPDVIDRVENAATDTMRDYAREPHLGGVAPVAVPDGALTVRAEAAGYVTGVDMAALEAAADAVGVSIHVDALPGSFVGRGSALARVSGAQSVRRDGSDDAESLRDQVCAAFLIEKHRTYEQDPRLGLVALAEIGSRALSPSTNDPGTAVEVLGAIERVLTELLVGEPVDEPRFRRVHVPAVVLDDLLEDAFRPLARDGAPLVEVGLRIQKVLGHLVEIAPSAEDRDALTGMCARAAERSVAGLDNGADVRAVQAAADEVFRLGA